MNIPDPYKVLQVDPEAEEEVIEAAYRRLARKYHPDVAPGPEAQERMVRINQAWEMLRNPTRRAAVDRARTRTEGSAARATAAEARAAAAEAHARATPQAPGAQAGSPSAAAWSDRTRGSDRAWSFPDGRTRAEGQPGPRPQFTSPDWSTGRSEAGHGYDPNTMRTAQGEGAAGPPPGNPYGSVLNFGRYAGWSLGEVARTDLEYLEWLDRTPIGRIYQAEIDEILRSHRRRVTAPSSEGNQRGLFRRR